MTNWLKQAIGLDDKETQLKTEIHTTWYKMVVSSTIKRMNSESSDLLDVHATFKKYQQIQGARVSFGRKAKQSQLNGLFGSSETD